MLIGQNARLLAFPHVHKLKPEWLGWLHNPQNQCLGLSPVDALDFILGKFSESSEVYSAGLLFFRGHNASCNHPDLV